MKLSKYRIIVLQLLSCLLPVVIAAQNVGVRADKDGILIGEPLQYEIVVKLPSEGFTLDIDIPDTIPHFEVLSRTNFDTSIVSGIYNIHQKITFTSFDSGKWPIPSYPVTIQKGNNFKKFLTDSVMVNVGYSVADSTNELRDIKPLMDVEVVDYFWWWVAGGALLAIILGIVIYWYWKKYKKRELPLLHTNLSPFDEAMKELEALRSKNLLQVAELKQFHTGLSQVVKKYFTRTKQVNLLNKTTGDLLLNLKQENLDPGIISGLAEILRTADAVKFAKFIPSAQESEQNISGVKSILETLHQKK